MIIWNFIHVEPEYGLLSAKQMRVDLQEELKYFNVEVLIGKGYVEVKNKNVKKEKLVEMILKELSANSEIDFIFYVGEDRYV
jgi:trehalose-6-phosphatase